MNKRIADNGKYYAPLSELMQWEKNPRSHTEENLNRLIQQIARLGQFKPVILSPEGKAIGGNKRLLALDFVNRNVVKVTDKNGTEREIDRRGQFNDVWITEIAFTEEATEATPRYRAIIDGVEEQEWFGSIEQIMIEYGLADNDEIGVWDKKALKLLIAPHKELLPMQNYKLQMKDPVSLQEFITPQKKEKKPKEEIECPACHHKFIPE